MTIGGPQGPRATVFLGLGSNLGDREAYLGGALERLAQGGVGIVAHSSLYETEPVGFLGQPLFLNAVVQGRTSLSPLALLAMSREIEGAMGRRPSFPNAPRPIDIDILFYDDLVVETRELVIPHPRVAERAFVLVPLAEVAPHWVHPILLKTAGEMTRQVDGRQGVRPWKATWGYRRHQARR